MISPSSTFSDMPNIIDKDRIREVLFEECYDNDITDESEKVVYEHSEVQEDFEKFIEAHNEVEDNKRDEKFISYKLTGKEKIVLHSSFWEKFWTGKKTLTAGWTSKFNEHFVDVFPCCILVIQKHVARNDPTECCIFLRSRNM